MKLETAIFCEDIRHEINNKFSIIGTYNDKILIRTNEPQKLIWPLHTRLGCWIRLINEPGDGNPNKFEFEYIISNQPSIKASGVVNVDKTYLYFNVALVGEGIPLQPGSLGFRLVLKEDDKILSEFTHANALLIEVVPA